MATLLEIKQVVDPRQSPSFRLTIRDGNLQNAGEILEEVPQRPRYSFSRVDFYLDVDVPAHATKQAVIECLNAELVEFKKCLDSNGLEVMQDEGHYTAQTVHICLDHQSYRQQGSSYYLGVFQSCIHHLDATPLRSLP